MAGGVVGGGSVDVWMGECECEMRIGSWSLAVDVRALYTLLVSVRPSVNADLT